ncbi:large subunit ribosomal protein L25 [Solimonas aquatica]|uniref:Large ribosomal subunit protein bL25 n=1 Tax=Solimonas aquatica TaxID=489703 RepID=A0A1H9DR76_9GAMM|nr:50S ribosomal protein L25/general stress protein Ctc [Solimonas aquatica]SEQ15982.1 large subunit ribosomal protein L25 [Solimonas aquatica]
MKENFVVNAEARADQGKGASRRLRREGKLPAVIYGGRDAPVSVSLSSNEFHKHLKIEAFYSHLLTLTLDGASQQVVLKDLQRHPVSGYAIHADFQRVLADQLLRMHVPLHFKGAEIAPGVKTGGGIVEHQLNQVEVECLPKDLPEFIEVDLSGLNVNESVHLSQLPLGEGVSLVQLKHGNDQSVASVHLPRAAVEEETPAPAEGAAPAAAAAAPAAAAKKDEKKK